MASLSKVSGILQSSIARFDRVLASAIESINKILFQTSSPTGFLVDYPGAAAAYSVRQLISSQTRSLRVQRLTGGGTGDADEADVLFGSATEISLDSPINNVSTGVTSTTLGEFFNATGYSNPDSLPAVAGVTGQVADWYDQSGNGNDASQAASANMPTIFDGTSPSTLIVENGKPAIQFDGVTDGYLLNTSALDIGALSSFAIGKYNATVTTQALLILSGTASSKRWYAPYVTGGSFNFGYAASSAVATATANTAQNIFTMIAGSTLGTMEAWVNATSAGTATLSSGIDSTKTGIGNLDNGVFMDGNIQEIIFYASDESTNRPGIETNLNTFYSIYNGASTSGFLFDYPGAEAAYSVRQLGNGAAKSMRVQRLTGGGTGDADEADVLFGSATEISLASPINNASTGVTSTTLGEFLNATGYSNPDVLPAVAGITGQVADWYDQTGNGSNITQASSAAMPAIFSGASPSTLIQENGKAAVYFVDNLKQLDVSGWGSSSVVTCDILNVHKRASGGGYPLFWYDGLFQVASYGTPSYTLGWGGPTVGPSSDTNQHLFYGIASNTVGQIILDGTASTAGTLSGTRSFSGAFAFQGRPGFVGSYAAPEIYHQEFIQWDSNHSSGDRVGIETNVNTFYSIYNGASTSGFLFDYPGAATAYSVRQLGNGAIKSMRVQRLTGGGTGDADEADVLFGSATEISLASPIGNVSTGVTSTTLGEFFNATGYSNPDVLPAVAGITGQVADWYDQTGNGNDATQSASANMPAIFDGTSASTLIQENGKAAVLNNGGTQELTLSSSISNATNLASVAKANTVDWNMLIGQSFDGGLRTRNDGKWYPSASVTVTIFQYQGAIAINGTELTTATAAQSQQLIFSTAISGGYPYALLQLGGTYANRHWNGPIQEFILWTTAQSGAAQTGIESNINTFYSIANFPSTSGFLFDYPGAAAAYSVRQLGNGAIKSMRVQRLTGGGTGDADEADVLFGSATEISLASPIGNASTGVTSTTLGEFLNATGYSNPDVLPAVAGITGQVADWYDQTGNGNDATQSASANMPLIFDGTSASTLIQKSGKPAIEYNTGGTQGFVLGSSITSVQSTFQVLTSSDNNNYKFLFGAGNNYHRGLSGNLLMGAPYDFALAAVRNGVNKLNATTVDFTATAPTIGTQYLVSMIHTSATATISALTEQFTAVRSWAGTAQEMVIYESAQTAVRPGIESNINTFYSIYNGASTSGFLFDYPGAATAYSVRQLGNGAFKSMRVQRLTGGGTGDADEADVLFGSATEISLASPIGNVSTGVTSTTLGEFFNATGYSNPDSLPAVSGITGQVADWYDQSGNGNDASQSASANMPAIFDGTSPSTLIVENGKPAVKAVGSSSIMSFNNIPISELNDYSTFIYKGTQSDWGSPLTSGFFIRSTTSARFYSDTVNIASTNLSDLFNSYLITTIKTGVNAELYRDATSIWTLSGTVGSFGTTTLSQLFRGRASDPNSQMDDGYIHEVIIYDSDQSSNRAGIETNLNTFYSIYP